MKNKKTNIGMSIEEKRRTINFYIIQAKLLSSCYEVQYKEVGVPFDCITQDIASEWTWNKPDQGDDFSDINPKQLKQLVFGGKVKFPQNFLFDFSNFSSHAILIC